MMHEELIESNENKLNDLFIAIYFNDLEKVIEIKSKFPEIYSKKECFLIEGKMLFDLKNLTFFNQTIWNVDNWKDEIMPLILNNRQNTEKMLNFWRAELGKNNIQREIEYNHYCDYFYCVDPNDPDEDEKVILDTIPYFLEKGFREIDLRLYNRIACFDFTETKKLLENGAKLDINFYEDGASSALSFIGDECSYLASCEVIPEFKLYKTKGFVKDYCIIERFGDLLGLAAFEDMNKL